MTILKFTKALVLILAVSLSLQAQAKWHQAKGVGLNTDAAVNDAIHNLLLDSGADMRLEQVYKDGVLEGTHASVASKNPIRKLVVLEQQSTLNRTTVTIKAYIEDRYAKARCPGSKISKAVLPITFKFADSAAFQSGMGIENLNKELDKQIFDALSKASMFNVRPILNANIANDNGKNVDVNFKMNNLKAISDRYSSQYIVVGTINSLSKSKVGNNILTSALFLPTRTIDFDVDIYDAINQQIVFHRNYNGEEDWPFDADEFLDLRSDRFRGSDYGQRVYDLCSQVTRDLVEQLQCAPASAKVIDTEGDNIVINLGRENGLVKNMKFSLEQATTMSGSSGNEYDAYEGGKGSYKVVSVYPHAAKLQPVDLQNNILNVSVNDIVTLE